MPAAQAKLPKAEHGFVVEAGSLGGHYNRGQILPDDAFPEDRMTHFLARGAIRVATEEDVAAANAVPTGLPALGSTDEPPGTPMALFEEEKTRRDAEIEALEAKIQELEEARSTDLEVMERHARIQQEAMERIGALEAAGSGHSGASSTATNTEGSGTTEGGGEPSEPVDPAKQAAAAQTAAAEATKPSGVQVRGRAGS